MTVTTPTPWILLATLLRPQGRRGELLAESFTDFPETLPGRPGLYLAPSGFTGAESEARAVTLLNAWLPQGKNEGRIVLEISAVTSISEAQALAGLDLLVRPAHRQPLPDDDSTYISDLIGLTLIDGDTPVGLIRDLHFPTTPDGRRRLTDAAPLLVVDAPPTIPGAPSIELLIPFVRDHILRTDPTTRTLHMRLPAGLVDLQRNPT